jgi:hypothetical protein
MKIDTRTVSTHTLKGWGDACPLSVALNYN